MAQAQTSRDDDALKKKTDCVYFLASPLTCKKVCIYVCTDVCLCRVRKNTVYQSPACFWPPSPKIPFSIFHLFFFFFLPFLCFFFSWCVTKVFFPLGFGAHWLQGFGLAFCKGLKFKKHWFFSRTFPPLVAMSFLWIFVGMGILG